MYDDYSEDPWGGRPLPLLRRPLIRGGITFFVVFTFLLLTFVSTCSPRTQPIGTTTTTIDGVTAFAG
jgi:hypothetical protein